MKADGLLDPKTVIKLDDMAGIEVIITGTVTPMDNSIKLTVKATDVTRGVVIAAEYGSVPRTEAINDHLAQSW